MSLRNSNLRSSANSTQPAVAAKPAPPTEAFSEIRGKVLQRYGKIGLKSVGQLLRSMDSDHSGYLHAEELRAGLRDGLGVCISDPDFVRIVQALDTNGDGRIDLKELIVGLRGVVPNRRRNVIEQAFRRLDASENGAVDTNDLASAYDVSRHPDVLAKRATPYQVAEKFISNWDSKDHPDGMVTAEEFINYYVGVSETVPQDDQFELLLIRSWSLDRPNAASAGAALRGSINGQDGVSSRYNANHGVAPPPKNSLNGTASTSGTNTIGYITEDGAIARRDHPLYHTSMMEYGKTAGQHRHEPNHHLPGGFTKNAPPFSAGSGLNTATTRSKVI